MEQQPIRVMIVDDHLMVRDGLKVFLSIYPQLVVVAEAGDGAEAVARCAEARPDVILMDLTMPTMDGLTATRHIRDTFPQIQVIALTSFVDETLVARALEAGAISYLQKDVHADQLASAIQAAYRRHATVDARALALAFAHQASPSTRPNYDLTPRERDVLALLVVGKTNPAMATQLGISVGTVHLHVSHILYKLGVSNRTEAALLAVQEQLVS